MLPTKGLGEIVRHRSAIRSGILIVVSRINQNQKSNTRVCARPRFLSCMIKGTSVLSRLVFRCNGSGICDGSGAASCTDGEKAGAVTNSVCTIGALQVHSFQGSG